MMVGADRFAVRTHTSGCVSLLTAPDTPGSVKVRGQTLTLTLALTNATSSTERGE